MKKISKKEMDWFDKEGNPVIVQGKALRDIGKDEELISYGKIWNVEDLK